MEEAIVSLIGAYKGVRAMAKRCFCVELDDSNDPDDPKALPRSAPIKFVRLPSASKLGLAPASPGGWCWWSAVLCDRPTAMECRLQRQQRMVCSVS